MNSSRIKYVIVEPSFLLVRGLIFTLHQIRYGDIAVFMNDKNLLKNIEEEKPNLLLINLKFYKKKSKEISLLKKKLKFDVLILSAHKNKSDTENFLYYEEDKINVYHKISMTIEGTKKQENDTRLSKREEDIVQKIAIGLSNKEIAKELFISIHTVMTHRKNIIRKLNINSVSGLTVYAIINQLIEIKDIKLKS